MKIKIFLFLIIQEILFRALSPIPDADWFNRASYEHFVPIGQGFCPMHYTLISESSLDNFKFEMKQNLHGFRGDEFKIESEKERVIFIGDSFVEGWGSSNEETIPKFFEKNQNNIEAINLGITGSGPERYKQILEDSLPLLKPNSVVMVFSANDFPTTFNNTKRNEIKRSIIESYSFMPRIVLIFSKLLNRCLPAGLDFKSIKYFKAIPDFVKQANLSQNIKQDILDFKFNPYMVGYYDKMESSLKFDYANSNVEKFLIEIKKLCSEYNANLLLVYIPYSVSTNPYYGKFQAELGSKEIWNLSSEQYLNAQHHISEVSKKLNINFLDLTKTFSEAEKKGMNLYWPYDAHCNSSGYKLAAESIGKEWLLIKN